MTAANAFWRVFPPSLFLIVSLFMSGFWSHDPLMFIAALTAAGACGSWLIVATVEVVKLYQPESNPARLTAAAAETR
jgi:hypothetical protein